MVQRLYSLIDTNIEMEKYSFDPDTKARLYIQMSRSYLDSPDLRISQLLKLAKLHERTQNIETSANVYIYTACIISKYLDLLDRRPSYFPIEEGISLNIY